jgi:hypothetical protein
MDFTITNNGQNPLIINFREHDKFYNEMDATSESRGPIFDTVVLNAGEGRAFYDTTVLSIKEQGV